MYYGTIPKEFKETLGIQEGDEVLLSTHSSRVIVERYEDLFKVLEEVLGTLTFSLIYTTYI